MKKLKIIILPLILLISACASLVQKDAITQEVINRPKMLFSLKTATLEEVPIYDESECYQFEEPVTGFRLRDCVDKSTFQGRISTDPSLTRSSSEIYQVKWPDLGIKMNYMGPTGWVECNYKYSESIRLPEDKCIKKYGNNLSKKKVYQWHTYNNEIDEIEIITKKKLTTQQRKNMLQILQKEYTEEYNKYIKYYQTLSQKWQNETSAMAFCNDIKSEWMDRECDGSLEGVACVSLATPFMECYKQGFIKLSQEYINANF